MILFGSAAQGSMSEASDLDVVLVFADEPSARQASRGAFLAQLAVAGGPDLRRCGIPGSYDERSRLGGLFVARTEGREIFRQGEKR